MHLVRKKPYQKTKYEVQNLIVIVAVMIICSNELRSLQHSSVLNRNNLYQFLHLRTAKINLHYQIIELLWILHYSFQITVITKLKQNEVSIM